MYIGITLDSIPNVGYTRQVIDSYCSYTHSSRLIVSTCTRYTYV